MTVHFSTPLDDGTWLVELRERPATDRAGDRRGARRDRHAARRAVAHPAAPYPDPAADPAVGGPAWRPGGVLGAYLARHGRPIRYSYVPGPWPLAAYQTVFARDPGSAEMPSAGRPFTTDLVTDLVTAGVVIAPITLHAGVASLETGEPPLPERFAVPETTARLVNLTRAAGRRVVAVGTTVHPGAGKRGRRRTAPCGPASGWTDLVLGADRPARVVDRPDHRLARPGGVAPGPAGGGRRAGAGPCRLRRGGAGRLPVARVRRQLPAAAAAPGRGAVASCGRLGSWLGLSPSKVVIVTDGASGIGRAVAGRVVSDGGAVVDRRVAPGRR